jgi:hypothetical protein
MDLIVTTVEVVEVVKVIYAKRRAFTLTRSMARGQKLTVSG